MNGKAPRRRAARQAARRRGIWAERLCVASLRLRGYAILGRGHVTGRGTGAGEIDIIARRGKVVAIIEVKARDSLARAAEAVSAGQRRRLIRGAQAFLASRPELGRCTVRFDVMLVAPWRWPRHLADAWREDFSGGS